VSDDEILSKLEARIASLTDQELIDVVEIDFADYRKEAIDFAKQELARRGITFEEAGNTRKRSAPGQDKRSEPCEKCGERARHGVLFENREIIFLFDDVEERRFVDVVACRSCGHVKINVDLKTEIEDYARAPAMIGGFSTASDGKHRCPHCGWEPDADCEWYCDKCGCYWNTFETHGRCPTCNYLWTQTACDNCGEWSDHDDWYVEQKSES
jgi:rubrerythrin